MEKFWFQMRKCVEKIPISKPHATFRKNEIWQKIYSALADFTIRTHVCTQHNIVQITHQIFFSLSTEYNSMKIRDIIYDYIVYVLVLYSIIIFFFCTYCRCSCYAEPFDWMHIYCSSIECWLCFANFSQIYSWI